MAADLPSREPDQPDWDSLARELAGEHPAGDATARAWLEQHPEEAARIQALDAAIQQHASSAVGGIDVEAALQRVAARRDATPAVTPLRRPWVGQTSRWRQPALLAAAAVLV